MSIDRDTFENTTEDELKDLSVPNQVLGSLAAHDDRPFKTRDCLSSRPRRGRGQHCALATEGPWLGRKQGNLLDRN